MVKAVTYYFRVLKRRIKALTYNMHTDADEQFFKRIYAHYISPILIDKEKILEIGCQYGRFTIELIQKGKFVTATDIDSKYGTYIKKQVGSLPFIFKKEGIFETLNKGSNQNFDVLLCLEVLHFIPGSLNKLLERGKLFLSPDGLLVFTFRPTGFFIEKSLSFRNYEDIKSILEGSFNNYECFRADEIMDKLNQYSWKLEKMVAIGVHAKKKEDFAFPVSVPSKLKHDEKEILFNLEIQQDTQHAGLNSARYILVIASPK
jgi:2-polyprenyl-3-methyl-5-hydroxy-6-metoxy-1,4-benzoquinol methylase